jgi:hypothetical protein
MKQLLIALTLVAVGLIAPARTALAGIVLGTPQQVDGTHFDLGIRLDAVPPDNDLFGVQGHIALLTPGFQLVAPTELGPGQPAPLFYSGENPGEPLASYSAGPATFQTGDLFILHIQRNDPTKSVLELSATVDFAKSTDELVTFALPAGHDTVTLAVPEPATAIVMIAGLGLLGLTRMLRRRDLKGVL